MRALHEGLTLVLGGARSGKSRFAETLLEGASLQPVYLATAQDFGGDGEMTARIAHHVERRGPRWRTVEAPLDIVGAIEGEAQPGRALLVDCLTLWLTNLMLEGRDLEAEGVRLAARLASPLPAPVVLVSNEVGFGIVPDNAMARAFRDATGRLHQTLASVADEVHLVVAGLPLAIKG